MAQIITNDYVIAAILGNWQQESNINPAIWENLTESTYDHEYQYDGIGGFGLGQWTNIGTRYGRLWNLEQYSKEQHVNIADGGLQIDYFVKEDYWIDSPESRLKYTTLSEFINSNSTSLSDLTWDFCACWEGVAGNQTEKRLEYANNILAYIQLHKNDSPAQYQWISGNRYLSTDEILNNAMTAYFYFTDNTPTPPIPPTPTKRKHKKMPLWMYLKWN